MKVMIMYHSQTGHTKAFAEKIAAHLNKNGASAVLHELETVDQIPNGTLPKPETLRLKELPALDDFDALCIGSPIWAFRCAPLAIKAMQDLKSLRGKKFLPFVTMGFPLAFLGGSGAIKTLSQIAVNHGAIPMKGSIITYMLSKPEAMMDKEAERIGALLR
ncbi:MAG TPA: hypothetical protein PL124_00820 [Candidatus Cloacimonadota bacterium]|nr:hypothetical protein [Candidatus Cloacimonadota bacterium]HPS37933.1 hypothetical protein [Candidatus Cloacimonadota bacterium]